MKQIIFSSIYIFRVFSLCSQSSIPESFNPSLRLNLPLIDANHWRNAAYTGSNFNRPLSDGKPKFGDWAFSTLKNPSMCQATEWNQGAVTTLAWGSQLMSNKIVKPNNFIKKTANVVFGQLVSGASTYILGGFPLGGGWLHEEYHRAMLATNRVASKDPFDDYQLDLTDGSVKNIYDDALRNFKKNDPHGFNRMLIAGAEGELLAAKKMQENNFFNGANLPIEFTNLFYTISAVRYFNDSYKSIDSMNIPLNKKDGANMMARDFTGHDYSGWIWHLFKPNVPYDSLGIHPSGVGINRYINSDRLTKEEKNYYDKVKKQAWLSYMSPMIFGFRKIKLKDSVYVNFAIQYQPTSFGTDRELRFYYMNRNNKYSFGIHQYQNYENSFYAAEFNWVDMKIKQLENFSFTTRMLIGTQPNNQEFFTEKSQLFGLLSLHTDYAINKKFGAYIQLQAKTDGWVAGDEYLTSMVRLRSGLWLRF